MDISVDPNIGRRETPSTQHSKSTETGHTPEPSSPSSPPAHNLTSSASPLGKAMIRRRRARGTGTPKHMDADADLTTTCREQTPDRPAGLGNQNWAAATATAPATPRIQKLAVPQISEQHARTARRHRHGRRRRGGERAAAPLFLRRDGATTPPPPPRRPILLCTHLRHRSRTPPLSHRRNGGRRGERPSIWPSVVRETKRNSVSPLPLTVARGTGRKSHMCS